LGSLKNPHGHEFLVAIRTKSAGNVVECAARLIGNRLSSGSRGNSGGSSRNSTPFLATVW
jgi:hypothetical protein